MTTDNNTRWYVIHARPQRELLAAGMLEDKLGLTVYLPTVRQRFRGKLQPSPFFPGYFFVQADLNRTEASAINKTPGVIRLVSFGGEPRALRNEVVEAIRAQVDGLNGQGGLPPHGFKPGDPVRMIGGPLEGMEAVFIGPMKPSERVKVLLNFMQQDQEVEVGVDLLEKASAAPAVKRPRRTRGRGRRVRGQN